MDLRTTQLLLTGIAAGDALGSTSEFATPDEVPAVYRRHRDQGWPFRQVGGGTFGWAPGQTTDDTAMARCLVRAVVLGGGRFDGALLARQFVDWLRSRPRDIGTTTSRALNALADGAAWDEAGRALWQRDPDGEANGSLMRNGVVPGLCDTEEAAFRLGLLHGLVTHYGPLCAVCCGLHTWLLRELLAGRRPASGAWLEQGLAAWLGWLQRESDPVVSRWREDTATHLPAALARLRAAAWDPDAFRPHGHPDLRHQGHVLLTLQIAVWALHWSLRDRPLPAPRNLPAEVFDRTGPFVLAWVALIGADADTYGAVAGPLLAAAYGGLPAEFTAGLPPML